MTTQRLTDRVVIVTGATSGIGRAIAERCLAEGACVIANGRREEALWELAAGHEARVVPVAMDLTEDKACARLLEPAEQLGRLDGLVHAAGTVWRGENPRATSAAQFGAFVEANLSSAFLLTAAVCGALADGRGGSVVILGSQLAHVGAPGYETYTAAKGAVTAMARSFAAEYGPRGVRVNVLAPGLVRTPMAYVDRKDFDDLAPALAERHPLRRIGRPEDLAGPAAFLLSDDAAWLTGHTLIVDGGFTCV